MALQDLTPQLRTRLSRVERAVGLFVTVATLLLVAGFAYYLYATAKRKGWFLTKVEYSTSLNNATGLKPGDPVKLMGFIVGEITVVKPNDPSDYYGVTVYYKVQDPNFGYIWTDSRVRVAAADFLGNRFLEIIKGQDGIPTVRMTNGVAEVLNQELVKKERLKRLTQLIAQEPVAAKYDTNRLNDLALEEMKPFVAGHSSVFYLPARESKPYWIEPIESPAVTERLEQIVDAVEKALPKFLALTNQLTSVLGNAHDVTVHLDEILVAAKPTVANFAEISTNLVTITGNIRDPHGSLGQWLLPTNLTLSLDQTLQSASSTLSHTDTNLTVLVLGLDRTLENLANLTSNLNAQVQVNTNIVSSLSQTIVHSDEFIQGLKNHWLLRSAFKTNKTQKAAAPAPRLGPKK